MDILEYPWWLGALHEHSTAVTVGVVIVLVGAAIIGLWKLIGSAVRRLAAASPSASFAISQPPPEFTGRVKDMRKIHKALLTSRRASITTLAGMGGIGKTAAARQVAHDLRKGRWLRRPRFRDGGVEIDLRGYHHSAEPMGTEEALRNLLGGLGLPADGDRDALKILWRTATSGKDMLVLLDNAREAHVVEDLMPGDGATVLVTSREDILGNAVSLNEMTPKEAKALVAELAPRVPDAQQGEIADLGFHVPLVIDVIAREVQRLDTLSVDEALSPFRDIGGLREGTSQSRNETIAAIFGHSVAALPDEEQPDYAALSLCAGGFFAQTAAIVWNMENDAAKRRLADWAARGLVEKVESPFPGRWRLHDLLLDAAARRLAVLSEPQALAIRSRWAAAMLKMLETAYTLFQTQDVTALALFDLERLSIEAAQSWAAEHWQAALDAGDRVLAVATAAFPNHSILDPRLPHDRRLAWLDAALLAARALEDQKRESLILGNIGWVARSVGNFDRARDALGQRIELARSDGDKLGEAQGEGNLGLLLMDRPEPDLDGAEAAYHRSLALSEPLHGDPHPFTAREAKLASARSYGNLGILHRRRGNHDYAIQSFKRCIVLLAEIGARHEASLGYFELATTEAARGDIPAAIEAAEMARTIRAELQLEEPLARTEALLADLRAQR